jgi:PrtD family type I secretion system ABC transporter
MGEKIAAVIFATNMDSNTNPKADAKADFKDHPENHAASEAPQSRRPSGAIVDDGKKPIQRILWECRKTFYIAIGITILVDLLAVAPMMYMWNVMDHGLGAKSMVTVVSLTALILALYLFWSALEWIRSRLFTRLSLRIDWDLSADIYDAAFRRHVGSKTADVHQLLGDLAKLRQFLTGDGMMTIIDAPMGLVFIFVGALIHPLLAVFALGSAVLMLILAYSNQKITSPILKEASNAQAEAARVAANSVRNAESTLALGMMGASRDRWYREHHKYLLNQVNATEATGISGGLSGFFQKSLSSIQMALGCFLAIGGLITGGAVMIAGMLISKAVQPIVKFISSWPSFIETRQSYERLNALLMSDAKRKTKMQLPAVQGHMVVSKLAAVPPAHNKAVLFDIDFQIKPGEVVAIVGPSAAGKTCLARMLVGVWKPARGSVRLDGVELSDWDHDEFGPQIGYVPQEIEFFEGSVAENIARLGEIDPEKVVQAAKLLGMHEIILSFPDGYDTQLGQGGFALSGGQRQRLAICRAIYGAPKFIVMDEPNSNLDEVGESALVHAIKQLKELGSAVIITTHRPRLVGAADYLLVLRNGKQVGFGPAEEMINAVRNLQVVGGKAAEQAETEGAVARKEGTNDAMVIDSPATSSGSSGPISSPSSGPISSPNLGSPSVGNADPKPAV